MEYVKPVIMDLEDAVEGVYASGSGEKECWSLSYTCPQTWNGSSKVYELKCVHNSSVYHKSQGLIAILQFDRSVVSVTAENNSDYQIEHFDTGVRITRNLYGNAFYSGDTVTFKIFVTCKSQSETEAVNIITSSISCIHT